MHIEHNSKHFTSYDEAALQKSILQCLLYFDIFQYPLLSSEIIQYSSIEIPSLHLVEHNLLALEDALLIYKFGDFYSVKNNPLLIERRKNGNKTAAEVMQKAFKRAKFIHIFPFVRSVNISGSLSKNYFDETTDFDFFIIAKENRIWLCRLLLTCYKKLFLFNSRKYFCINYYVDTAELEIPDKNLFAATEITTLKNQTGEKYYKDFIDANLWVKNYYPNFIETYTFLKQDESGFIKRVVEKICSGKLGDALEKISFSITKKFINKKYKHLNKEELSLNMRSRKHASKHHPQGFQMKVLKAFSEKCKDFEIKHQIDLT